MYAYTKLNDIVENEKYNVYGVIIFVKKINKGITIGLIDESLNGDKLVCNLFFKDPPEDSKLQTGRIIRIHRLKIEIFNDKLIGVGYLGFASLIFCEDSTNFNPIFSSSNDFTITDVDVKIIKFLRSFYARNKHAFVYTLDTLDQCKIGNYFDMYCQIIAKCQLNKALVLYVWDGYPCNLTSIIYPVKISVDESKNIEWEEKLKTLLPKYIVPIYVYDEHIQACLEIKVGSYVLIQNIHISSPKSISNLSGNLLPNNDNLSCQAHGIELILHGGSMYKRGIEQVSPAKSVVEDMIKRQRDVTAKLSQNSHPGATSPDLRIDVLSTLVSSQALSTNDCLREVHPGPDLSPLEGRFFDSQGSSVITSSPLPTLCQCSTFRDKVHRYLSAEGCRFHTDSSLTAKPATSVLFGSRQSSQDSQASLRYRTIGELKRMGADNHSRSLVCGSIHDYSTRSEDVLRFLNVHCPTCHFLSKCPLKTLPPQTPPASIIRNPETLDPGPRVTSGGTTPERLIHGRSTRASPLNKNPPPFRRLLRKRKLSEAAQGAAKNSDGELHSDSEDMDEPTILDGR